MNTRIHTVFINTETVETIENTKVFEHVNEKTGEVQTMGEGEVNRMLRVYVTRVLDYQNDLSALIEKGETEKMIQKKRDAIENNIEKRTYWENALKQITAENTNKTVENSVLRLAA